MNKKVGILNLQHCDNYGAVLQAAALQEMVKRLGFEVEHINFKPFGRVLPPLTLSKRMKRICSKDVLNIVKNKINIVLQTVGNSDTFEEFRKQHINRTSGEYGDLTELQCLRDLYDFIIVGSDQVWRGKYTNMHALVYYLAFAGDSCKRIAYAASFGLDHWETPEDAHVREAIKREVKKFSAISVREDSGVNICKDELEVDATHVLDPTLLIGREFFEEIIGEGTSIINNDLVVYKLDPDEAFFEAVKSIAANLNFDIEDIYYKRMLGKRYYNGVREWLRQIRNSRLVFTDSFHGTCFSILFEKQFVFFQNKERGMARIESLLGQLNLKSRICFDVNEMSKIALQSPQIDYSQVNRTLHKLRADSHTFLKQSLGK